VAQALLAQLRAGLDVEGVLDDLQGDARHFCRIPQKNVLIALEEVDKLTFLFGAKVGSNLDGLSQALGVNLYDLGILDMFECIRRGVVWPGRSKMAIR
jgi:hypothetical protein